MKINPKHKYLLLMPINIYTDNPKVTHVPANEILSGKEISNLLINTQVAMVTTTPAVYCLKSKQVYNLEIDINNIPPKVILSKGYEQLVLPLEIILDLEPDKLIKYTNHKQTHIANLAKYLLSYNKGDLP